MSLVLPVAGIAYFLFLRFYSTSDPVLASAFRGLVAGDEQEAVPLDQVIDAIAAAGEL